MKKAYLFIITAFLSVLTFAQDGGNSGGLDIKVNTNESSWYTSPWVWVVGAAVFILLLVALTRGGGRKNN